MSAATVNQVDRVYGAAPEASETSAKAWKHAKLQPRMFSQQTCSNVFVCNLATCHSDGRRIFLANPAVSLIVVGLV